MGDAGASLVNAWVHRRDNKLGPDGSPAQLASSSRKLPGCLATARPSVEPGAMGRPPGGGRPPKPAAASGRGCGRLKFTSSPIGRRRLAVQPPAIPRGRGRDHGHGGRCREIDRSGAASRDSTRVSTGGRGAQQGTSSQAARSARSRSANVHREAEIDELVTPWPVDAAGTDAVENENSPGRG